MTSTHKHHITSIKCPSHKSLPKISCLHYLRILIMFWLFKDSVVIMKKIMSRLFKDPINSGLSQFDHAQSNSKKWPKRLKRSNCSKWIFSWKTTNKIFMYLLAPFILQNFKKILRADPELWGCAIFGPKMAHLSWTKFFWYKPLLLLSSTYWPFSLCKILKNSYSGSRIMTMHHFWTQNGKFAPNFYWKLLLPFSSSY